MSKKKVKRWRSGSNGTHRKSDSKYRKPDVSEQPYRLKREDGQKMTLEAERRYQNEKNQHEHATHKKKVKNTGKYQSAPGSVRSDETLTERRRKQRAKKRRRNNLFVRIAIGCVFLVIAIVVCIFVFFKIGKIRVEGSEKYKAAQVIEASGVELGDNLYTPTAASIQSKLDKKLPYIYAVTLKHELPDTLVICVKETNACYAFKSTGAKETRYLLTDRNLKLLEVAKNAPNNCAVIEGASIKGADIGEKAVFKEAEKGEMIQNIHNAFSKNHLDNISEINVANIIDISVIYAGVLKVEIGQANDLDYKCKLAAGAIEDVLKDNKKATGTINVKQASQTKQAYYKP